MVAFSVEIHRQHLRSAEIERRKGQMDTPVDLAIACTQDAAWQMINKNHAAAYTAIMTVLDILPLMADEETPAGDGAAGNEFGSDLPEKP